MRHKEHGYLTISLAVQTVSGPSVTCQLHPESPDTYNSNSKVTQNNPVEFYKLENFK